MTRRGAEASTALGELEGAVAAVLSDGDHVPGNSRAEFGITLDGSAFLWPFEFEAIATLEASGARLRRVTA